MDDPTLPTHQQASLDAMFNAMDTSGNGVIDRREYDSFFNASQALTLPITLTKP